MKIRIALLLAIFATTAASLHANSRVNPNGPYDLSHSVAVKPGLANMSAGDNLTIDAIHGSADKITAGNIYKIEGHYTLASHDNGSLTTGVTSTDTSKHAGIKDDSVEIARGEGTFAVYMYVWHDGNPHICVHPVERKGDDSFDCLYFNGLDAWSQKK